MAKHTKLYEILGVSTAATQSEITKAYKLCALKHHPDKNTEKNKKKAAEFFLQVQNAYNILKNPTRRENYDKHGWDDEESETFKKAYDYFQFLFAKVTQEEISSFEKTYKNSDAQKEDLIQFYNQFKGDISKLLEWIPLSSPDDIQFYIETYEKFFKQNLIKKTNNFEKSIPQLKKNAEAHKKFLAKEKKQFDKTQSNGRGMDALVLAMEENKKKQAGNLASLLENLESKYSKEKGKKKNGLMKNEPTEDDFKAMEERIKMKKKNVSSPKKKISKKVLPLKTKTKKGITANKTKKIKK